MLTPRSTQDFGDKKQLSPQTSENSTKETEISDEVSVIIIKPDGARHHSLVVDAIRSSDSDCSPADGGDRRWSREKTVVEKSYPSLCSQPIVTPSPRSLRILDGSTRPLTRRQAEAVVSQYPYIQLAFWQEHLARLERDGDDASGLHLVGQEHLRKDSVADVSSATPRLSLPRLRTASRRGDSENGSKTPSAAVAVQSLTSSPLSLGNSRGAVTIGDLSIARSPTSAFFRKRIECLGYDRGRPPLSRGATQQAIREHYARSQQELKQHNENQTGIRFEADKDSDCGRSGREGLTVTGMATSPSLISASSTSFSNGNLSPATPPSDFMCRALGRNQGTSGSVATPSLLTNVATTAAVSYPGDLHSSKAVAEVPSSVPPSITFKDTKARGRVQSTNRGVEFASLRDADNREAIPYSEAQLAEALCARGAAPPRRSAGTGDIMDDGVTQSKFMDLWLRSPARHYFTSSNTSFLPSFALSLNPSKPLRLEGAHAWDKGGVSQGQAKDLGEESTGLPAFGPMRLGGSSSRLEGKGGSFFNEAHSGKIASSQNAKPPVAQIAAVFSTAAPTADSYIYRPSNACSSGDGATSGGSGSEQQMQCTQYGKEFSLRPVGDNSHPSLAMGRPFANTTLSTAPPAPSSSSSSLAFRKAKAIGRWSPAEEQFEQACDYLTSGGTCLALLVGGHDTLARVTDIIGPSALWTKRECESARSSSRLGQGNMYLRAVVADGPSSDSLLFNGVYATSTREEAAQLTKELFGKKYDSLTSSPFLPRSVAQTKDNSAEERLNERGAASKYEVVLSKVHEEEDSPSPIITHAAVLCEDSKDGGRCVGVGGSPSPPTRRPFSGLTRETPPRFYRGPTPQQSCQEAADPPFSKPPRMTTYSTPRPPPRRMNNLSMATSALGIQIASEQKLE